ncbi:MAG: glycogen synthase GlgA [Anaerostipes sp.]|nr:glycogen synthase GlgA [Anaerostipes sp.]MDD5968030.1 glycogen synthase GlgA [Anaerostipes sp.]
MKKILFAASECVPFIKTGGLADVCGALPKEFDKNEWDVRVVIPNYECIPNKYRKEFKYITHYYTNQGSVNNSVHVGIMEYEMDGIRYYFIDNLMYFGGSTPYTNDMKWDIEKFSFFSKAVLSILPIINFKPDVIHCHDWQTGLIPVYLKNEFSANLFYHGIKTVMTIHNLRFQGIWDIETMKAITGLDHGLFTADKLEFYNNGNMLKGGLVYADAITTVSDTYAEEIKTMEYGEGLQGILNARSHQLTGIVNGIDYDSYNPATDENLFVNYTKDDFRKKKFKNKLELQEELGLPVDKNKFMIGLVSRLTDQKGLDLIEAVMDGIIDENTQFVVVGTGQEQYEAMFRHYQNLYPDQVSANILYSDKLARKLYAAADAFLMPSRFEPCGLTQLISFRYGTAPIVRETGGLKDTVIAYNAEDNSGDGFSFVNYNAEEMLYVINLAKELFFDNKRRWNQLVERGMNKDFSWGASKKRYEELYNHLMAVRAEELRMLEEKRAEELRIMEEERKRAEAEAKEALAKKEAAEEEE